jgi:hypothetical protein
MSYRFYVKIGKICNSCMYEVENQLVTVLFNMQVSWVLEEIILKKLKPLN